MKTAAVCVLAAVVLVGGCGKKGEDTAKNAGQKVGESVADFTAGVGRGVDSKLLVKVELTTELQNQGISQTIAKWVPEENGKKGIAVYLVSKKAFKGMLITKALNKEGQEIGRSVVEVEFGADDAQYTGFKFDGEMDAQLVEKYVMDVRK